MKWTYSIRNKMAASAALFTLCILVLFSNYVDRNHTNNVKNSISTLYEDRLIVEDYILKMTIDIYEIKLVLHGAEAHDGQVDRITTLLSHIEGLSQAYLKTKLTTSEDETFSALLKTLKRFESPTPQDNHERLNLADEVLVLLNKLSAIQLDESKSIMQQVEGLYRSGKVASQFAFGITIVILLILQALVFASKTLGSSAPSNTQLN